jgi:hypothetical protein
MKLKNHEFKNREKKIQATSGEFSKPVLIF